MTTSTLRVLIIAHGHPARMAGGTESAAYRLFAMLKGEPSITAHHVTVSEAPNGGARSVPRLHGAASDEWQLDLPPIDPLSLSSTAPGQLRDGLRRLVEMLRPDLVHVHHYLGMGLDALATLRALRIRTVLTLHEFLAICHRDGQMLTPDGRPCAVSSPVACAACFPELGAGVFLARDALTRHWLRQADALIAPSAFLAGRYQNWLGSGAARIRVVRNVLGAPPTSPRREAFDARSGQRLDIGYFGRFTAYKGFDVALDGLALLTPAQREPIRLHLHGGGLSAQPAPFQAHVESRLSLLGQAVVMHGPYRQESAGDLMALHHAVLVPSIWWENAPVVIQEAHAAGVPVLASRLGGMAESITERQDGLLFLPASPSALAQLLVDILAGHVTLPRPDPARARQVSQHAFASHLALYRELVSSGPAAAPAEAGRP